MGKQLARVPAWAWLAAIVTVSTLVRYVLGRHMVAPWIMVDEIIYSELAKNFADTGRFLIRGEETGAYGFVYPLLISPAWAVFDAVPDAYAAAKAINALVMSLAAVPAYFLARRVVSRSMALFAAALTVAVPPMLYTGLLMTENAFYPVFLIVALAMVAWLERPSWARLVILLGVTLVALLTRAQAIAFAPAFLTAPFLVSGRRALREFAPIYVLTAIGAIGLFAVQLARGSSMLGILGAYEVAGRTSYTVRGVLLWLFRHWSELVLALGVIPFAALVLLALTTRELPRPERAFVAVTVTLSFWFVLLVATFASKHTLRVEERDMFYVMPLFLIALLLWVERGAERPTPAALIAAGAAALLPALFPYSELIGLPAVSDTPALLPLWWLGDAGVGIDNIWIVVTLASLAAAALFLLVPARYAVALPVLVLVYFAVSQRPIHSKWRVASVQNLFAGITAPHRNWVDRKVGQGADVALIWSGNTDRLSIWENEFFNRSVRRFYYTTVPLSGDLPEQPLEIDRKTGLMHDRGGRVVRASYVLTDGSVALRGRVVAEDARKGMLLYRVNGPLRQISRVEGLYPQDTWSGREVTYTRHDCRQGTLAVELQSDPALFREPNTVVARVADRVVARTIVFPALTKTLRVPLEADGDTCMVRFTVENTAVPSVVTGGENPDPRELGMHFNRFTYRP